MTLDSKLRQRQQADCWDDCSYIQEQRAQLEAENATLRKDTLRMEFAYWYVRNRLHSDGALESIALLFGDAPVLCNCREAICPHTPVGPSLDGIREALDACHATHKKETLRDVLSAAREASDDE